ncbi:MAG: hypothetical protein AUH78_03995 [Gemmatimonadetes bacterium 13_1_40CM_4_69_8]|nr:MAG: hypothetical protein AUH78_03995 [Gemmatimonadetes bacterium 13_1_40CM_4_69_8]
MSAAGSQNSTTLGSVMTRGVRSALSVESRGTNAARSTESAVCVALLTPRAWHAVTHPSASSMAYLMR